MADTAPAAPAPASPTKAKKPKAAKTGAKKVVPTHPPTAQMVNAAIKNLKERGGSSLQYRTRWEWVGKGDFFREWDSSGEKFTPDGLTTLQAIKKYIAATYKIDAEKLAPFIRKYLKSAVTAGKLVQTKGKGASGSFKLSAAAAAPKKEKAVKPKKPAAEKKAKKPKSPKKTAVKKVTKPKKTVAEKKPAAAKKVVAAKKPKSPKKDKKPKVAAAKPKTPKVKKVVAKKPAAKKAAPKKAATKKA
ncbi:histone H1-III-like [Neocloeon triangulifer]|uniref:histone H1-III-like n=1 Tax=Neocloeon triangulifer TaxID=2078957 RepID=UPI00286F3CD6|nr:histone H1-III-like [Neocloeon triangulifer]